MKDVGKRKAAATKVSLHVCIARTHIPGYTDISPQGTKRGAATQAKGRAASAKRRKVESESEEEPSGPVFEGVKFVLLGELSKPHDDWSKVIKEHGGSVMDKRTLHASYLACVLSTFKSRLRR
jgi:hypothetical protein